MEKCYISFKAFRHGGYCTVPQIGSQWKRCKKVAVTGRIQLPEATELRMQFNLYQSEDAFAELTNSWQDLLTRTDHYSPFQSPAVNQVWWSTLGGGEWEEADLWILAGYGQDDRLLGLGPFFHVPNDAGGRDLRLIGSKEISDYLDLIIDPDHRVEFISGLISVLGNNPPEGFSRIILNNLLEDSPSIPIIEQLGDERGWQVERQRVEPSPLLLLPDRFERYLEELNSKQRRELKRKMRRAADYPASVDWRLVEDPEEIGEAIEVFLQLMAFDVEKQAFLTDSMKAHFRALATLGAEAGWLHLAFLDVSGEPAFGYLNFVTQNRLWVYNSGFDPRHYALSPGWVLMGHLIQWAIDREMEAVDFMRGDEDYKYRLGGSDRFICRILLNP
jgi:CelD/BcsL family acetyltransferase involved in cellulose biosynthesis